VGILDLFFPINCLACNRDGKYICEACLGKVKTPRAVCPECLRFSIDGKTHTKCLQPQGLNGLISLWQYGGVIRKAILVLKYKFAYQISEVLSEEAARIVRTRNYQFLIHSSFVLVPVPLYWLRKNRRGFNQSELIGRNLARNLGWHYSPDLLIRRQMRVPQTELKREERLTNIHGIFALNPKSNLQNATYILFDDVWTTGATLKEAAKVLKRAGIKKIWGLTLARGVS